MIDLNSHILALPYEYEEKYDTLDMVSFIEKIDILLFNIKNIKDNNPYILNIVDLIKENYNEFHIPSDFVKNKVDIFRYSNRNYSTSYTNKFIENIKKILVIDIIEANKEIKRFQLSVDYMRPKLMIRSFSDVCSINDITDILNNDYEPHNIFISFLEDFLSDLIAFDAERANDARTKTFLASLYNCIISFAKGVIDSKLFWIKFMDLFNIETDNSVDFYTDDTSEDENDEDENDEDDEYSLEDISIKTGADDIKNKVTKTLSLLSTLPVKVSKLNKKFKLFRTQAKNHFFYKKYMGRIDGLYERHGDTSLIENTMKDDPVKILKEDAKDYILTLSREFSEIYSSLSDMSKKFQSMSNPKEALSYIKKYMGMYGEDINKSKKIPFNMIKATKFKVAEAILNGNKIYGYNAESIVDKKLPPANYTIISLFVEDSHEKPHEQQITDIFKDVNSFKLIAKNEKEPIFELTQVCNDVISKGVQKSDISNLSKSRTESRKRIKRSINDLVDEAKNKNKEKSNLELQMKYIWNGIEDSMRYTVKMKKYITELIDAYFTMMIRIDNLCKEAIVAMLEKERMSKDERMNTGFKGTSLKSHKQYKQNEDDTKTKGEKEASRMNKDTDNGDDKKAQLIERVNEIRKAMRR